ncbi:hypothetical protein LTS16_027121, partial [Friedmanniomyces endolithicus]
NRKIRALEAGKEFVQALLQDHVHTSLRIAFCDIAGDGESKDEEWDRPFDESSNVVFRRPLSWYLAMIQVVLPLDLRELMLVEKADVASYSDLLGFFETYVVMQVFRHGLESQLHWEFWSTSDEDAQPERCDGFNFRQQ